MYNTMVQIGLTLHSREIHGFFQVRLIILIVFGQAQEIERALSLTPL